MNEERPDPERLLARIKREESGHKRGRLKIFFGAVAGVGKTYAMLEEARLRKSQGVDVLVGWVETHGRSETAELLTGLELLPPRAYVYRGTSLREFDLDAALARRPQLIILDELAHTNAPGARHAKRWNDAEELLAAGIDVHTTLNVQHIESLNDVVAQTTGIVVKETVPDSILERADDIELVDLTPEDLLERLKEGKVYIPAQAERAVRGFFKKGNLIALRELALRRVAERVDSQLRTYKDDEGIHGVWPVTERILVSVSTNPEAMRIARAAARMAAGLRAEWIVAYVERPGDLRESESDRSHVERTFHLAEQLGAETVTLTGVNVSDEILAYARSRNVTKIVVGKPARPWWRYRLLGSVVDELVRRSDEIDVYVIRGNPDEEHPAPFPRLRRRSPLRSYLWAAFAVGLTTALCRFVLFQLAPTNLVMIYLLEVVVVASILGRGPSILASILSVAVFDFFFIPPHLTLAIGDTEYLVTFVVMLIVGVSISSLAVRLRQQADAHRRRQERTASLYRMSRELARTASIEEISNSVERHMSESFDSEIWLLLPDAEGRLVAAPGITSAFPLDPKEIAVAEWARAHGKMAGRGTSTLAGSKALFVPLITARGNVGVLGLYSAEGGKTLTIEQIELLDAFAGQVALVIERAHLAVEAQAAQLRIEAEKLQNLLLSSVSHDLRTPLAAITGAASSLLEGEGSLGGETQRELTQSILEDADRLNRLVGNLLSMTRIESGAMQVRKEWQPLEEVVGAALNHIEKSLRGHPVEVRIPDDLPLLQFDGVLIEQVLLNLLENAIKYTPAASPIDISADVEGDGVVVSVADRGPGLRAGDEERIFEKFYRATHAQGRAGVGLGLPICKGIVEAHGGRIWARNRPEGGAVFQFLLRREGQAPTVESVGDAE